MQTKIIYGKCKLIEYTREDLMKALGLPLDSHLVLPLNYPDSDLALRVLVAEGEAEAVKAELCGWNCGKYGCPEPCIYENDHYGYHSCRK
jgi:hypothetical protein